MMQLYLGSCKFFFLNLSNNNKGDDHQERSWAGQGEQRAPEARRGPAPGLRSPFGWGSLLPGGEPPLTLAPD